MSLLTKIRVLKILFLLSFVTVSFCLPQNIHAQCMAFAKTMCKPKLAPYIHDGNYNAVTMSEGESGELIKTFFSGQKYRIVVSKVGQLPKIRFWITDPRGRIIYDNSAFGYADVWDFEMDQTQTLSVNFKILEHPDNKSNTIMAGCVAILFGIDDK